MPTTIALLRGINVGGKSIKMAALREIISTLGFTNPRTLLQSGNAVFESETQDPAQIAAQLEHGIKEHLGLDVRVMIRSPRELDAIIAGNPFPDQAEADPSHLLVTFLADAPGEAAVAALKSGYSGPESIAISGREAYLYYPAGVGHSKLTNVYIEKQLGTAGTARNWNTVLKLRALVSG